MVGIGKAKEIVGQQAVVGGAVVVEEPDIGLDILHGEGLAVAVALVDAVQTAPHAITVGLGGATTQCHQYYDYRHQVLHACKGTNK